MSSRDLIKKLQKDGQAQKKVQSAFHEKLLTHNNIGGHRAVIIDKVRHSGLFLVRIHVYSSID